MPLNSSVFKNNYSIQFSFSLLLFVILSLTTIKAQSDIPFRLADNLLDMDNQETLGLSKAKSTATFTVFEPQDKDNHYNHGVVLFPFRNKLYAMWQTSKTDEDAPDTHVVYSVSADKGKHWSKPKALTHAGEKGITTSGGWWTNDKQLYAFINYWPEVVDEPKEGVTLFMSSTDGVNWSEMQPVTDQNNQPIKGVIEQDLRALPNRRIVTAFHIQPGLIVKPFFTDNFSATRGWTQGVMQNMLSKSQNISRELEPSWFYKRNGDIVMVFRDQESSYRKLASVSKDNGLTWSTPAVTNYPDSRAKQSAGNFDDGTAYQVSNPTGNKTRIPLVVTISKDGDVFDKAFLLRAGGKDLPIKKYDGKYKSIGYSYPKSIVWKGYLYAAYATNKETIQITRVKCSDLIK